MPPLNVDLHVRYIQNLDLKQDLAYHLTEHLRVNGVYWGLVALCLMGRKDALDRDEMIRYVMSCWDDQEGAFGAHPGHDVHVLGTLSAIQILIIQEADEQLDVIRDSLVRPDGTVAGDKWGETDTRFAYIVVHALSLLGRLSDLDEEPVVQHLARCMNFDGAFGTSEGAESHGAQGSQATPQNVKADDQVFVCVAALTILDRLEIIDQPTLAWWLSERQLPNGGLNGRPEKLEDVCYSWWNLSALSILGKLHWINRDKLIDFILGAQDLEDGGIADRPGDWVDVFHTNFGVCGLSLLGYPGLEDIDPVYCLPASTVDRLGLRKPYQILPRH